MPLQITPNGLTVPSAEETAAFTRDYQTACVVRLPQLLHPRLLRKVQARMAQSQAWTPKVHDLGYGVTTELVFADEVTVGLLTALFHDASLFRVIRAITGCPPIRSYLGRIYRMEPRAHADLWHTDAAGPYLVGLSVNLTPEPFDGGALQLRERESLRPRAEVANTGQGDGVLFCIDTSLEHMVTPVTGTVPKIAWAGWFHRDRLHPALDRLLGDTPRDKIPR